jgi:hypothetical protein
MENRYVINEENGILINDTAEGFCRGIEQIAENVRRYDNKLIQANSLKYSYEEIVRSILMPYITDKINRSLLK